MKLLGRLFITGNIVAQTGLHIGGSGGAFAIGGVDNPVIADQLTRRPYIPGSSLRGKMRSLTEKSMGRVRGQRVSQIEIHSCRKDESAYPNCPICNIYGITSEKFNLPTRLIVRDVPLTEESANRLWNAKTSLPYTEVKTEVAIDRITSQATPRDVERVPASAVFGPMELIYSIYQEQDVNWLSDLLDGMELLEDDYLGGLGSRGSGKIVFKNLTVTLKKADDYRRPIPVGEFATLADLSAQSSALIEWVWAELKDVENV